MQQKALPPRYTYRKHDRDSTVEAQQHIYGDMLRGCEAGERRAQMAFYDMFAPAMHATACRMLDCAGEAEEVVQEVLLRTLTNRVLLLPDHAGMARRLRRMVINECISLLRKRHIMWETLDECGDPVSDDEDLLLQEERSEALRKAIEKLPPQSRTIVQLAVLEEMDYDDIASLLNISNAGVRAHLTRAKYKLINFLKNERR